MKHLLIPILILFICSTSSLSQSYLEVKTKPLRLLAKMPNLEMEYAFNENLGVSLRGAYFLGEDGLLSGSFGKASYYMDLNTKYYAAPKLGSDGFYGAIHFRYQYMFVETEALNLVETIQINRIVTGVNAGYKWVANKNFTIDFGLGIGRAIYSETIRTENIIPADVIITPLKIDFLGQLAVGYRFALDE